MKRLIIMTPQLRIFEDFSKVLSLDPTNADAYFNRSSTFDCMGQHNLAMADYSKALELAGVLEKRYA